MYEGIAGFLRIGVRAGSRPGDAGHGLSASLAAGCGFQRRWCCDGRNGGGNAARNAVGVCYRRLTVQCGQRRRDVVGLACRWWSIGRRCWLGSIAPTGGGARNGGIIDWCHPGRSSHGRVAVGQVASVSPAEHVVHHSSRIDGEARAGSGRWVVVPVVWWRVTGLPGRGGRVPGIAVCVGDELLVVS